MKLIDADALLKELEELFHKREEEARFTGNKGVSVTWNDAIYYIKTAPTIDAVRHGHWIVHYDDIWPEESTWECSVCHEEQGEGMLDTNYCPACGAKMDEVEDG